MSGLIKNSKKLAVLFVFPLCLAGLLIACENEFMNNGVNAIIGPVIPIATPVTWNTNTLYIDPKGIDTDTGGGTGAVSGTIAAVLNNGGKKVWFSSNLNNTDSKQWELIVPADETDYLTAGSLKSYIKSGPTVVDNDQLTLIFGATSTDGIIITKENKDIYARGKVCTLQLYPDAFYGADRDSFSMDTAKLDFNIVLPTITDYTKYLVEKKEYGSISVTWLEGSQSAADAYTSLERVDEFSDKEIVEAMKFLAGSVAAYKADAVITTYDNNNAYSYFDDQGTPIESDGRLSVVSWDPAPDLSGGWLPYTKYALHLSDFYSNASADSTVPPVSPVISAPILFMSDVGSISIIIQAAERAGYFSALPVSGSASTVVYDLVGDLAVVVSEPTEAGEYQISIAIPSGGDGAPAGTISVKAVYLPAPAADDSSGDGGGGATIR